ncbi:Glutamate--tRNA ligase [Frankliniella fusca]|uniref:Glutamate--tRNA ligase n=1 Tax=Frankliniella fusca TaxID=407009 RepID=A0AAE1H5A6_9NEOP|nr:Glutamate--tRNA ligase [Frankliniella fusca]
MPGRRVYFFPPGSEIAYRQKAMFDSYLAEFMIRRRWLGYGDQRVTFLEKIKEVYKLECSDGVDSETKTAEAD